MRCDHLGPGGKGDEGDNADDVVAVLGRELESVDKKWKACTTDADGKQHHIGRFDDDEAARAVNKAISDAGLEGERKTNAVDADGRA